MVIIGHFVTFNPEQQKVSKIAQRREQHAADAMNEPSKHLGPCWPTLFRYQSVVDQFRLMPRPLG